MNRYVLTSVLTFLSCILLAQTPVWTKHEIQFKSTKTYDNPIYNVRDFKIVFSAPSGREKTVQGFWDGGNDWKVRFMPDEVGTWSWKTQCSDKENEGLHNKTGTFECIENSNNEPLFQNGAIRHEPGKYYLSYNDGTPFFWLACTAWNGALKSTGEEWEYYLNQRKANNYNTIQLVTTEWRGADKNAEGLTAIEGAGYIHIHPEFFKRIDERIDQANAKGLLVSPVVLWALPFGEGRHLSPGYTLPLEEAVLLAKYIIARYQGNHVVWTLGGDGKYYDDQEVKWKEIGQRVFNEIDHAPVTLHPHGSSWVGDIYDREDWYSLMSYQSSHNNGERVVNWINREAHGTNVEQTQTHAVHQHGTQLRRNWISDYSKRCAKCELLEYICHTGCRRNLRRKRYLAMAGRRRTHFEPQRQGRRYRLAKKYRISRKYSNGISGRVCQSV